MITLKEAMRKAKEKYPNYEIYSGLEYPDSYVFSLGPSGKSLQWMDNWFCINKRTGEEIEGRSFSTPDSFMGSKPIKI